MTPPFPKDHLPSLLAVRHARAPDVYAGEQEQPYDVDEMPVPRGEFEAEVLFRGEMASHGAQLTNDHEDRADDYMRAMESGRHKEGGAVNVSTEVKMRMRIFISLHSRESQAKKDCEDQTPFQSLPIIFKQRVMRPGHRGT